MCARARRLPREERYVASAAVAGGALLAIGAFLPWLTLYAGLHPLRGVIGLNGRVLAAGGAVCLVPCVRGWVRPAPGVRWVVAPVGGAPGGFSVGLLAPSRFLYRDLHPNRSPGPRLSRW